MAYRIEMTIKQRQPGGEEVKVEFKGPLVNVVGTEDQIRAMMLEAEMKGNTGKSRLHLFMHYEKG